MNDFEKITKKLYRELRKELPGFSAQKLMAPLGKKPPIEYLKENVVPKESAVLILLYPEKDTFFPTLILTERADYDGRVHSGQIAFPGGSFDKNSDIDLMQTALRETEEEIGITKETAHVLGQLPPLYIPVSNFMVTPFLSTVAEKPSCSIQDKEVKGIIEVRIAELFSEKNKSKTIKHIKVKNQNMEVPCYTINGKIIWGATAMILSE